MVTGENLPFNPTRNNGEIIANDAELLRRCMAQYTERNYADLTNEERYEIAWFASTFAYTVLCFTPGIVGDPDEVDNSVYAQLNDAYHKISSVGRAVRDGKVQK